MAHYESVNNVARRVTKKYEQVGNVARSISKHYESVDNIARLIFGSFNFLSHIYTTEYNNSGGSTVSSATINENTLKLQATSGRNGKELYDGIYYVLFGLNSGDFLEIEYDFSFDNVISYYVLVEDYGEFIGSNSTEFWKNTCGNKKVGTYSYTQRVYIPEGCTQFSHWLRVVGNYPISASIDVKSIKINGTQIFPS